MIVRFLGVRGSTPTPGPEFTRYGGHTSCVALSRDGEPPRLVFDAGTGIRRLTAALGGAPFDGVVLLGHLHWDHTQGLPFCRSIDHPEAKVQLFLPDQGADAVAVLSRALGPPHFPIEPSGLQGEWTIRNLAPGRHELAGFEVLALDIPHKGGRTFGYRVSDGNSAVAYMSDHGPAMTGQGPHGWGPYHEAALRLADDVDVLIHDAQHTAEELPRVAAFGHSAADYAVELGRRAGAAHVVLFHHDPNRTDDDVDALVERFAGAGVKVSGAREGEALTLGGDAQRPAFGFLP